MVHLWRKKNVFLKQTYVAYPLKERIAIEQSCELYFKAYLFTHSCLFLLCIKIEQMVHKGIFEISSDKRKTHGSRIVWNKQLDPLIQSYFMIMRQSFQTARFQSKYTRQVNQYSWVERENNCRTPVQKWFDTEYFYIIYIFLVFAIQG